MISLDQETFNPRRYLRDGLERAAEIRLDPIPRAVLLGR